MPPVVRVDALRQGAADRLEALVVEAVRALLQAGVRPAPDPDLGVVKRLDRPVRSVVHLTGSGSAGRE